MTLKKIKTLLNNNNFDFYFFESVDSTMSEIKKLNFNRNICLMANEQKKGYGRRGTFWESPRDNIYMSILTKNTLPIENHFLNNAFITNMICNVIEKICNIKTQIKWPNDILINNQKISGIISEIFNVSNIRFYNTGIGINIKSSPNLENYPTTNVNKYNKEVSNFNFVFKLMEEYLSNLDQLKNDHNVIMRDYKSKLLYLGDNIKLKIDEENIKLGTFHNLNLDGSIIIKNKNNFETIYNARIII
tara:strand:+ start:221 stop:958 length:738 start_codon:yes stop_codon:yes gene_type:complete